MSVFLFPPPPPSSPPPFSCLCPPFFVIPHLPLCGKNAPREVIIKNFIYLFSSSSFFFSPKRGSPLLLFFLTCYVRCGTVQKRLGNKSAVHRSRILVQSPETLHLFPLSPSFSPLVQIFFFLPVPPPALPIFARRNKKKAMHIDGTRPDLFFFFLPFLPPLYRSFSLSLPLWRR